MRFFNLGNLWQVCITSTPRIMKRNQRKFKVMRTQHLILITSHLTDHHCTVSVRTNQHRHKMLDILPSKPQGVRTQLASSSSPSPSLSSWSHRDGGLQGTADCTVSCLPRIIAAACTPHLTCPAWLRRQGRPGLNARTFYHNICWEGILRRW